MTMLFVAKLPQKEVLIMIAFIINFGEIM